MGLGARARAYLQLELGLRLSFAGLELQELLRLEPPLKPIQESTSISQPLRNSTERGRKNLIDRSVILATRRRGTLSLQQRNL